MMNMYKDASILASVGAIALSLTVPASAQLAASTNAEIMAAASTCFAATDHGAVDTRQIVRSGWVLQHLTDQSGRSTDAAIQVYYKTNTNSIILVPVSAQAPGNVCSVRARLNTVSAYSNIVYFLDEMAKSPRTNAENANSYRWFPQGHIIQSSLSGTKEAPNVRISIMHTNR